MKKKPKNFPLDTLARAKMVYAAWSELLQKMEVPNFSLADLEQKINETNEKVEIAEKVRKERRQAVEIRNELFEEIWALTKRVRAAVNATFGADSKESDKFGGKPVRFPKQYRPSDRD
jgi:hypothetical protein